MAIKASATITLFDVVDIDSTTWYYLLQSSTASPPAKPTTATPSSSWKTTEPSYTAGSTNTLYTVMKTTYSDGTFEYSAVSKSSSYEAAKAAYNKATAAAKTATNYMRYTDGTGLVVGDMTASALGNNVLIDSDSVDIRNGSKTLSSFNSSGVNIYGDNTIALCIKKDHDKELTDVEYTSVSADNYPLYIESTDLLSITSGDAVTIKSMKGGISLLALNSEGGSGDDITVWGNTKLNGNLQIGDTNTGNLKYAVLSTIDGFTTNTFCADFVVEQGTKGIWTYRKWASGVAECWGGQSYSSLAINNVYGNWYYHSSNAIALPFTFSKLTGIQASAYATSNGLYGVSVKGGTSTSQISFYITSAKAETSANLTVELYVSGRWK